MNTVIEKTHSYFDQFCDYIKKDTKGTEIGIYTFSGILFGIACYKVRPISKFRTPSDIPKHFMLERLPQNGIIQSIESNINNGTILRINHKPSINLFITSKKTLPVKLSGIQINANGFSWLQSVAVNNRVKFVPLFKNPDNAECKVYLVNSSTKNPSLDLAECLISLGFGRAINDATINTNDKQLLSYYKKLEKIEKRARNDRNGLWSFSIPPSPWPVHQIKMTIANKINSMLPASRRLPELIR